jgi:Flp pilus assembly protein TadD
MTFRLSIASIALGACAVAEVNPRVEFALGVLEEIRGHKETAATHFETARQRDPTAAPLVEIAANRCLANGDRQGAIRLRRELAEARPDDIAIQLGYADFLTTHGRGDALAIKLATETLEAGLGRREFAERPDTRADDTEIIRRLFAIHHERGNAKRAAEVAAMLDERDPAEVLLFANLSRTLHDAKDESARAEVARRFDLALTENPGHPPLARAASEFHRNAGDRDKAIAVLTKHIEAAPWSLALRARLGILLFSAKRDAEGERVLRELLTIHPRHGQAHESLAKFHRLKGDAEAASHHAGEALKIRGGDPSEFLALAEEHLTAKRPREARLLLEKAVFDHPDDAKLRMKLAVATQADPDSRDRAARLFREAEAAAPEGLPADPAFLSASAEALIAAGQSKAAEERLRAAIRSYPPDAKLETAATLRRLASLWESENRNPDAARALRARADALDPTGR